MYITDFYMSLIIGVIGTLLFVETFGITPGGIIVASYLALVFDSPITMVLIFLVSFITCGIVNYILPKFVILYGRRRFLAMLFVSMLLNILITTVNASMGNALDALSAIRIVIPGLIANAYYKQGIKLTVASSLGVSLAVYAIITFVPGI